MKLCDASENTCTQFWARGLIQAGQLSGSITRASEYLLSAGVILRVQLTLYHKFFPVIFFSFGEQTFRYLYLFTFT